MVRPFLLLPFLLACHTAPEWRDTLRQRLPLYGHRNVIAVVDAAYPAQARAGIETVVTGADHAATVQLVAEWIAAQRHVRARVLVDRELAAVPAADAPGIDAWRARLPELLPGGSVTALPHAEIIQRLDQAAATFQVLLLKTDMALPYTSVFFELECGYWSDAAEQRLRAALANQPPEQGS